MPTSQKHIDANTPMGANLTGDGVTFRVWAPQADAVHVCGAFTNWKPTEAGRLLRDTRGYWAGFVAGIGDGEAYKFYVESRGFKGFKRDPYARELTEIPAYPHCNCVVRAPSRYPWHDAGYRPPLFNDLVIYQFHVGTYFGPNRDQQPATFLDVLDRIDYLADLGINAIEPLPVNEFAVPRSQGYDDSDLFSPEVGYCVEPAQLPAYHQRINALLARKHLDPLTDDQLAVPINQLKAMIDVCHVYGIAVIFDMVYNHVGSDVPMDESIYFLDRVPQDGGYSSLYLTPRDNAGPIFAFGKPEVRQFFIDNATFYIKEYHVDGLRYDLVNAIVSSSDQGWAFCQALTSTVRYCRANAIQVAENWPVDAYVVKSASEGGAGFDATWDDRLRESIRSAIGQASFGQQAPLDLDRIARDLTHPEMPVGWQGVQYVENHDEVYVGRAPRIAALADGNDHRSWYARSRSRVAAGLVLTAPGIPMLFMGQEFLEDRPWSDDPTFHANTLIDWAWESPGADPVRFLHRNCTRDLVRLRRKHPALRGEPIHVFHVHNSNRVIAFQRWLEGIGRDLVIVASLNEQTFFGYELGFPQPGLWLEVFNSDAYDPRTDPPVAGNGGRIVAAGPPLHGLPFSAAITIPANGLLVFARDAGD